jgi:hypothetical protein
MNPFDQFDNAQTNPFDQFDVQPKTQPVKPSMADKLKPVTDAAKAGFDITHPIDSAAAGLESAAHLVSELGAYPAGVVAGLGTAAANAVGLTNRNPLAVQEQVSNALTYQPKTAGGKQLAQGADQAIDTIIGKPINTISSGAQNIVEKATGSKLAGETANLLTQGAAVVLPGKAGKMVRERIEGPSKPSGNVFDQFDKGTGDVTGNAFDQFDQAAPAAMAPSPGKSLADAVIQVESGNNPKAINKKSGAAGLGQFMPETAKMLGIDPMDPVQAKAGVNKYLDYLQQKFGNIDHALMAYNWGEGNVQHWLNGDINPKTGKPYTPPKETTQYVAKVKAQMGQSPVVQQLQAIRPSAAEADPEVPQPEDVPIPEESPTPAEADTPIHPVQVADTPDVPSSDAAVKPAMDVSAPTDTTVDLHAGIPLNKIPEAVRNAADDLKNTEIGKDITEKIAPIASSPEWAQKVGKEFINKNRLSENQFSQIDKLLTDNFTPEQRQRMFQAADEESVAAQQGKSLAGTGTGYERLTPDEKAVVDDLHQRIGDQLWQRSVKNGLASGNGLPEYVPRSVVIMKPDGSFERVPQQNLMQAADGKGFNLSTKSSNLKKRNYLTLAETEAAARQLFGPEAMVANDIRVLPMAYARLERANHGVEFVKALKDASKKAGIEAVSRGEQPGYVTYDHPALTQGQPRFVEENGKLRPLLDETGKPIIDRVPLKIHKDLKGVVSAVLDRPSGAIYKKMMEVKAGAMQLIMYSPLIHNAVEAGRAFPVVAKEMLTPAATTKTIPLKIYKMGNDAKNTPAIMREAILAGLDPIGGRYAIKDATGVMNELTLNPGKSLTAKAAGKVASLISPEASLKTRSAIDKAGEIWHNKLLWDRVGDLQMGIYMKLRDGFIEKGLTPHNAQVLAAHEANRFAGALPKETMSKGVRAASHVALFSPSFTYGNLGVLKDTVMGLPGHVRSLIEGGPAQVKLADSLTRKGSFGTVLVDIGMNLAMVAVASTAIAHFAQNQTWEQIWEDYKRRAASNVKRVHDHPQALLNPIGVARGFLPQSENEQGKENRVLAGYDKNGTAIYIRLPFGKIGEEFESYLGSPLQILKNKESTFLRPLLQTIQNDKGNGKKVYLEKDPALKEASDIALNALSQQIPLDAIESGRRAIAGKEDGKRGIDAARTLAPLAGITVSQGFPGGPAEGLAFHTRKDLADMRARELPEINQMIREGNLDDAVQKMVGLQMTGSEIRARIKSQIAPQSRMNARNMQEFYRTATPEDQERMNTLLNR